MRVLLLLLALFAAGASGCCLREGSELVRSGDEIVVAGRYFHTGTPVVLWTDPGGYDAYRVEKRFAAWDKSQFDAWKDAGKDKKGADGPKGPERFGLRFAEAGRGAGGSGEKLDDETLKRVRGGGWTLEDVQARVDQFVLHYDVCGCSRQCFNILHDHRGLSVHFMLDIDGTIYQTLDVKERAWHATTSNDRSVGVEIASPGAMSVAKDPVAAGWVLAEDGTPLIPPAKGTLGEWYIREQNGAVRLSLPKWLGDGGVRTRNSDGSAFVPWVVPVGAPGGGLCIQTIQGQRLAQYPYTPQQRAALVKLTATLCQVLPNLRPECPRNADGTVATAKLPDDQLAAFTGVLGHYHVTTDKIDPGPALDFEALIGATRDELRRRK
ncbi:MAG: peptidoglycan recognition family protein [Phycisphaerales bacterium]